MGYQCQVCGEWVPDNTEHKCSGIPLPKLPNVQILTAIWHVNTESTTKSVGEQTLASLDWSTRLKLLGKVVKQAVTEMEEARSKAYYSRVLPIFVAPEFLFNDPKSHFVDEETKERIRLGLIELGKAYPEVLIVPGSIAWFKTLERSETRGKRKALTHEVVEPRSFGKYLERYPESILAPKSVKFAQWAQEDLLEHRKDQLKVFRQRLEEEDPRVKIAHNTVYLLYGGGIWHKYSKRNESIAESSRELPNHSDYKNILFPPSTTSPVVPSIFGLKIGIEVCVDHEHATLLSFTGRHNDLQIVCSASVFLARPMAALSPGGILIQADSRSSGVYRVSDLPSGEEETRPESSLATKTLKARMGALLLSEVRMYVPSPYFL